MAASSPPRKLRVAIYARQSVSVDEGIDQQIEECTRFAEIVKGAEIIGNPYVDNKTSASVQRGSGTAWADMLADFDAGKFDAVVAVAVDRLLRRVVDVVELQKPARPRELRAIFARDGIDTATSLGKVILTILVALAEAEIENKKARVLPFRDARHARGVPAPGMPPYGYRWIPQSERQAIGDDDARYAIVPDEAEAVRYMFREAVGMMDAPKGIQIGAIARALRTGTATDTRGAPLADSTRTTRKGTAWLPTTVRKALISPYYAALLPQISAVKDRPKNAEARPASWNAADVDLDQCVSGNWEPIIQAPEGSTPADVLRAVRGSLLDKNRTKNGGSTAGKWLLSGIARCGKVTDAASGDDTEMQHAQVCGAPVTSGVTREKKRGYRCPRGHFHIQAEVLDAWAVRTVLDRLERPDAASLLRPAAEVDTAALRVREAALEGRRVNVLAFVGADRYTLAEADAVLQPIEAELAEVRAALAAAYNSDPLSEIVSAADVRAYWSTLSLARRRAVLSSLMTPVISPAGKGWKIVESGATRRERDVDEIVRAAWRRTAFDANGLPLGELTPSARSVLAQPT